MRSLLLLPAPMRTAHILALARGWQSAWQSGLRFIENYTPEWAPGTSAQYHYVSFSWIIGGIVERVSPPTALPLYICPHTTVHLPSYYWIIGGIVEQ